MIARSIAELMAEAAVASEPKFTAVVPAKFGGVDPLGLRQINFGLMDQVFPGLNNVARHIRPFVVVTWAWRRAGWLARAHGPEQIAVDLLRDFVDRVEVIYAWSQLLRNPDADLPGRVVLAPLLRSEHWTFGGEAWRKRREERRYSTALTAPINYGPLLKTFGWVASHQSHVDVMVPAPLSSGLGAEIDAALDAFEEQMSNHLDHPAFSQFGEVRVTAQEANLWSEDWALEQTTEAERCVMAKMLFGSAAPSPRQRGVALALAAVSYSGTKDAAMVRSTMAGPPSSFAPPNETLTAFEAWRRVQVRQLFRLSLEALLYWISVRLEAGPLPTQALVSAFLTQAGRPDGGTAKEWLDASTVSGHGPVTLINEIMSALRNPPYELLAPAIANGIAFCIAEAPEQGQSFERPDRLPLYCAKRESITRGDAPAGSLVQHILESWVLAQHVYWSVGRGLADARARGKLLLRLKVVLEEGGWQLTSGASGSAPVPTPDRLATALSLAEECGLLS